MIWLGLVFGAIIVIALAAEVLALRAEVLALREERDAPKQNSAVEIARRAARSIGGSDGL
jgi:hypothetical protein